MQSVLISEVGHVEKGRQECVRCSSISFSLSQFFNVKDEVVVNN